MDAEVIAVVNKYAQTHDDQKVLLTQLVDLSNQLGILIKGGKIKVGDTVQLPTGVTVTIVDNFETDNAIWRPALHRRFDISAKKK